MASGLSFSASSKCMSVSVTQTASTAAALSGAGNSIRIVNKGPNIAYFAVGATGVVATVPTGTAVATCTPILAGEDATFTRDAVNETFISAICDTGLTTTIFVACGEGQ